jgi:uncharacterized protein YkwD
MRRSICSNPGAFVVSVLSGAAAVLTATTASADPLAVVNAIRIEGCDAQPTPSARVQPSEVLDTVAQYLSRGRRLSAAMERVGYPAATSASYHVRGSREDGVIRQMLVERFCDGVNDPQYSELGMFQKGDETWIVLAARATPAPALVDRVAVEQRVLELVNAARGEARTCGRDRYEAAAPLTLAPALTSAALLHAGDMARRGSLGHQGSDGSSSGDRITRAGYLWQASGENVAGGQRDADAVVAAWLTSPGHCATLMAPYFTETGIAFALAPASNPSIYWTQVFATPR